MTRLMVLILVVGAGLLACAQGLRADDDDGGWELFSSEPGAFDIELPRNLGRRHSLSHSSTINGVSVKLQIFLAESTDGIGFIVAGMELPQKIQNLSTDELFRGVQQAFAEGTDLRVSRGRKITVDKHAGMEWTATDAKGATGIIRLIRTSSTRIAMLAIVGNGIARADQPVPAKFFNSFKAGPGAGKGKVLGRAERPPVGGRPGSRGELPNRERLPGRGGTAESPPPAPYRPERIADPSTFKDLVAYWSFDEGDKDAAKDHGPAKADARITGARPIAGVKGQGLVLNGAPDMAEINGDLPDLNFAENSAFTVAGWFCPLSDRPMPRGTLFSLRNLNDGGAVVDVLIQIGNLRGQVRGDAQELQPPAEVRSRTRLAAQQWYHFALLREKDGTIALYLDGALQGEAGGPDTSAPITTNLRAIGCELHWVKTSRRTGDAYCKAIVDEFCIFKRALTGDEIAALAGRGK
jgi:hypothetical protein